jgi:hypothetical protein
MDPATSIFFGSLAWGLLLSMLLLLLSGHR